MTKRKEQPKAPVPLFEDEKTRKAHESYLREYRKRMARLKYEASADFLERPPYDSETPES